MRFETFLPFKVQPLTVVQLYVPDKATRQKRSHGLILCKMCVQWPFNYQKVHSLSETHWEETANKLAGSGVALVGCGEFAILVLSG